MKLTLEKRKNIWGYIFISLPVIFFLLVYIYPMFQAFQFSFQKYNTLSTEKAFNGIENYVNMIGDPIFWKAIWNSIRYTLFRAPTVMIISLITALAFQNITRGKEFLRTIVLLTFMISGVVMGWIFNYLYSRLGPITLAMDKIGVNPAQLLISPTTALYVIAAVTVWGSIGYYTLLFEIGLNTIPEEIYDAAKIDGASGWHIFRFITLPLLNPTIVLISIMAVSASLKNFDVIRNMAATGGPLNTTLTLPLMIYLEAFTRLNMGRASAITVVFFFFIMIITFIQLKVITKEINY